MFAVEAEPANVAYRGRSVSEVIDSIRQQGYPIIFSSQLVPSNLLVKSEPLSRKPADIVAEVLKPYGLKLKAVDRFYLITRDSKAFAVENLGSLMLIIRDQSSGILTVPIKIHASPQLPTTNTASQGIYEYADVKPGLYQLDIAAFGFNPVHRTVDIRPMDTGVVYVKLELGVAELEDIEVSTSRYVLFSNSQFFVDQRAVENLPNIGDDPLRATQHLPGATAGGWSAKSHFRGGEENESAIFLNGLQLLDPFHVRDYQNIFSSIDARSISGVEAYTGGFPARYGDHESGIVLLESDQPEKERKTELGVSVFNTSVLTTGYSKDEKFDWLVSARRSNLQYVLDKHLGRPDYHDMFVSAGYDLSPNTRLSLNALRADDAVLVVTESDPEDREQSTSDTRNDNVWLTLENHWTDALSSITVLSWTSFSNERAAFVHDPAKLVADVLDERDAEIIALKQDWSWQTNGWHYLQWGFEARHQQANYRYTSEARYFGFALIYPNAVDRVERDITADFDGYSYALYLSERIEMTRDTKMELGLRWDKQTFTGAAAGDQLSPRVSLFHRLSPKTDLRLTWGRYSQSQDIQELQVEDGIEHFFPAQRADHLIAGIQYQPIGNIRIRAEVYQKDYKNLRPRFENLQNSLALIPEVQPDRVRIAPDSARARGLELTIENRNDDQLDWWVSYIWSRVTDSIEGRAERRSWNQRHAIQAGLAWHKGPWEIGLTMNVHSGWPTTKLSLVDNSDADQPPNTDNGDARLEIGPRNAVNLRTFASFDLRVSRSWLFNKGQLSAFFELSNAFDRNNQCCVDYDIENLEAEELILNQTTNNWLPVLPAFGVRWTF